MMGDPVNVTNCVEAEQTSEVVPALEVGVAGVGVTVCEVEAVSVHVNQPG
jgi:hypothetical protein